MRRTDACSTRTEARQFTHSLRLFPQDEDVDAYNKERLILLNKPVARIPAANNCDRARMATVEQAQGLENVLYLSEGTRVMLKINLWTAKGLVNGALGTIYGILYAPGDQSPIDAPLVILVRFDYYSGPSFDANTPNIVPITPISRSWMDGTDKCTRTQFPFALAWAIAIHKWQGLTLESAVIDLGTREFCLGMSLVACSRVRSWNSLLFRPTFDLQRLARIRSSRRMHQRIAEERRLDSLVTKDG